MLIYCGKVVVSAPLSHQSSSDNDNQDSSNDSYGSSNNEDDSDRDRAIANREPIHETSTGVRRLTIGKLVWRTGDLKKRKVVEERGSGQCQILMLFTVTLGECIGEQAVDGLGDVAADLDAIIR